MLGFDLHGFLAEIQKGRRADGDELLGVGLPPCVMREAEEFDFAAGVKTAQKDSDMVFVNGTAGSDRITTLAAVINEMNRQRPGRVMTVAETIEFLHKHEKAAMHQREVGIDTPPWLRAWPRPGEQERNRKQKHRARWGLVRKEMAFGFAVEARQRQVRLLDIGGRRN